MIKKVFICLSYFVVFFLVIIVISRLFFPSLLNEKNFVVFDPANYWIIKTQGYSGVQVAFFPLFPLIWKWTFLNAYWISVFNLLIYLAAILLLIREYRFSGSEILLYLSIPSAIVYYLPFSESLFFICSTLMIIGVRRNNYFLVYPFLFLSVLSRPAFALLLAGLVATELFDLPLKKTSFYRMGAYLLVTLMVILTVAAIQYADTGEWFRFFSAQGHWGNALQWPKLPLTSWGGNTITKLDGVALLAGVLATIFLIKIIGKFSDKTNSFPRDLIFSLSYLSFISISVLAFRGGSLFSLNRFVFAVPYIIVAFHYYLSSGYIFRWKHWVVTFVCLLVFWLFFNSFCHIQVFLKYTLLSVFLTFILLMKSQVKWSRILSWSLIILGNFIFQIILFIRFLSCLWVA